MRAIENPEASSTKKLEELVKCVLERLEKQYPDDFEEALQMAMNDSPSKDKHKKEIRKLLGASLDINHTTLFLKLNNTSAEVRLDATATVVKALREGKVYFL